MKEGDWVWTLELADVSPVNWVRGMVDWTYPDGSMTVTIRASGSTTRGVYRSRNQVRTEEEHAPHLLMA